MSKKHELQEEFDSEEMYHFTHYDYLMQTMENGQYSAFKVHLREMSNKALVAILDTISGSNKHIYKQCLKEEIQQRMIG